MSNVENNIIITKPGSVGIYIGSEAEGATIVGNIITDVPRWYQARKWWRLVRVIANHG